MNEYSEKAKNLFYEGYNCSQAVFGTFSEELGVEFETAIKIASSFGGGMGRLREVCGAVSGMFMVAGMKYGYTDPKDHNAKTNHYKLIQSLADEFKQKNGSIVCKELLGIEKNHTTDYHPEVRTNAYYKKRPCVELVGDAAEIISNYIKRSK